MALDSARAVRGTGPDRHRASDHRMRPGALPDIEGVRRGELPARRGAPRHRRRLLRRTRSRRRLAPLAWRCLRQGGPGRRADRSDPPEHPHRSVFRPAARRACSARSTRWSTTSGTDQFVTVVCARMRHTARRTPSRSTSLRQATRRRSSCAPAAESSRSTSTGTAVGHGRRRAVPPGDRPPRSGRHHADVHRRDRRGLRRRRVLRRRDGSSRSSPPTPVPRPR